MPAQRFARPAQPFRTSVPLAMGLMGAVAMHPQVAAAWDRTIGRRLPSTTVRTMWWATIGLHVVEATGAARRAKRDGLPAGRWAAQTLVYGVFSLQAQRALTRQLAAAS